MARKQSTADITFPTYVTLDSLFTEDMSDSAFMYIVDGDGMEGAGIYSGDYLAFDPMVEPEDGEIVCLEVFGQRMVRRVFFIKDKNGSLAQICIRREDTVTPDLKVDTDDVRILGVFSGLIRNCRRRIGKRSPHYLYLSPAETEEEGRKAVETKKVREEEQDITWPEKSVNADTSISITKLGLPTRIMNCFLSIGMRTAKDLLEVPDKEAMLAIPGIGKGACEKVLANLESHGFDTRQLRW